MMDMLKQYTPIKLRCVGCINTKSQASSEFVANVHAVKQTYFMVSLDLAFCHLKILNHHKI